jgi:Domain of unknown function (DUF5668)
VPRGARPDVASLVAGAVLVAFGTLLLLDQLGAFRLRFATLAPIAAAAVGIILLASGLTRRG